MALQLDINKYGITFNNAYVKIEHMDVSKDGIIAMVTSHTSESVVNTEEPLAIEKYKADYDVNGGEALTQAYTYLKTLPEFSGATDV